MSSRPVARNRPSDKVIKTESQIQVQRQKKERKAHIEAKKNADLQEKLQQALSHGQSSSVVTTSNASKAVRQHLLSSGGDQKADEALDTYGHGSATDRLQFGYAPAVMEEAVLFHSTIGTKQWIAERKRSGRVAFIQKQKLRNPNCEPLTTVLKLKRYWSRIHAFGETLRSDAAGGAGMSTEAAEAFLDVLAQQQGLVGDAEGVAVGASSSSKQTEKGTPKTGNGGKQQGRGSQPPKRAAPQTDAHKTAEVAAAEASEASAQRETETKRRRLEML